MEADEHVAHGDAQSVAFFFGHIVNLMVQEGEQVGQVELFQFVLIGSSLEGMKQRIDVAGLDDGLGVPGNEGEEVGFVILLLQVELSIVKRPYYDATEDKDKHNGQPGFRFPAHDGFSLGMLVSMMQQI